jgi:hypothetical protein
MAAQFVITASRGTDEKIVEAVPDVNTGSRHASARHVEERVGKK